jgi:transcriptional regulator with GAF, ATPase, and Fis domain
VRELHQAMASAVALATEDAIEARHLPAEVVAPPPPMPPRADAAASPGAPGGARSARDDDDLRDRLVASLHENRGNVTAVARAFGKAPAQVHRWMHRFGIDPDTYRRE